MDLLFSKYASPFLLVDGYIQTGRFCKFIIEFIDIENEKTMWEFYLHKVYDKSYAEFKASIENTVKEPDEEQIETTISNSMNIINNFIPEE